MAGYAVGEMLPRAKDSKIDLLDLLAEVRKPTLLFYGGSDQVNGCQKLVSSSVIHFLFSFFKPGEGFESYRKLPRKPESCIDRLEDAIHNTYV
jgi:hypothetical protein